MIKDNQKKLPHIYASAAGLNVATYRNTLRAATGCSSCCDPRFNQAKFERAMASLETVLFLRVAAGQCENPIGKSRWIQNEFYWRNKLPNDGMITSRQLHEVKRLWDELQQYLHGERHTMGYLMAIIHKATGQYATAYGALSQQQADCLIDALKDRLAYCRKDADQSHNSHSSHTSHSSADDFPFGANAPAEQLEYACL